LDDDDIEKYEKKEMISNKLKEYKKEAKDREN